MNQPEDGAGECRIELVQGDITGVTADAIVNAANSSLTGGGGVDGAIHRKGGPAILEDCRRIVARQGRLPPGQAVSTVPGDLPVRRIIHTVGPVWQDGQHGEAAVLASCYRQCLELAMMEGCETVAFPSISTGAYGYPVSLAADAAWKAISDFQRQHGHPRLVRMVLYDSGTFRIYQEIFRLAVRS